MTDNRTIIEPVYPAFNMRDIDGALALMTEDVSGPKASEGGRVVGMDEIRAYWTRQCKSGPGREPQDTLAAGGANRHLHPGDAGVLHVNKFAVLLSSEVFRIRLHEYGQAG